MNNAVHLHAEQIESYGNKFVILKSKEFDFSDLESTIFDEVVFIDADIWYGSYINVLRGGADHVGAFSGGIVLLAILSEGDNDLMRQTCSALSIPIIVGKGRLSPPQIWEIASTIIKRLSIELTNSSQSRRSAAKAREELEFSQRNFTDAERFFWELGSPKYTKVFELAATSEIVELCSNVPETGRPADQFNSSLSCLRQRLPLSARGISAVDLYVAYAEGAQPVYVHLRVLGGNEEAIAEARSQAPSLLPGWCRLQLESAIPLDDQDFEFEVRCSGASRLGLSLSNPLPIERYCASSLNRKNLTAPLAMEVWKGLPGARLPHTISLSCNVALRNGQSRMLFPRDMPKAETLTISGKNLTHACVDFWWNENAFLVHPPLGGMTIAVIRNVDVGKINQATAFVQNNDPSGPPMKFAIAVVRSGSAYEDTPLEAIGNWTTLMPREWGQVHWLSETPITEKIDLILVAAVMQDQTNNRAWALFRGFLFNEQRG